MDRISDRMDRMNRMVRMDWFGRNPVGDPIMNRIDG